MLRIAAVLAFGILLSGSASAQETAAGPGRYQIVPDGDGFVRFDTQTGTLAHCSRSERVWRCMVVDGDTESDGRVAALQEELSALRAELRDLGRRLTALEQHPDLAERASPDDGAGLSQEQEQEFDEALSFAERMMQRFFDMIRELKNEQSPQRI